MYREREISQIPQRSSKIPFIRSISNCNYTQRYATRCVEMFDKENVSRHDLHVSTKSSLNRTKENTRRLRDLAINKKKKKKESTRCRAFPLTRLIVRKARETEISLLGQRGLLEREIFERTRNEHAPIKVFWRGGFARRRGINLRGAKEERKEEERRRLDTCPVFPRNFPLRPGNQFHRTPRPRYRSLSRGRGDKSVASKWSNSKRRRQVWATRLFANLCARFHYRYTADALPFFTPRENVDISSTLISNSRLREPP